MNIKSRSIHTFPVAVVTAPNLLYLLSMFIGLYMAICDTRMMSIRHCIDWLVHMIVGDETYISYFFIVVELVNCRSG